MAFWSNRVGPSALLHLLLIMGLVAGDEGDPETVGSNDVTNLVRPTNNTKRFIDDFTLSVNSSINSDIMVRTDLAAMSASNEMSMTTVSGVSTICSGPVVIGSVDGDIQQNTVVMVSCDDYLQAGQILDKISNSNPACTIMFSTANQACNLTNADSAGQLETHLGTVFTLLSNVAGKSIFGRVNGTDGKLTATISPQSDVNDRFTSSRPSSNGSTVAMAILYSVTGVVAAAFLFVIISGAIRVHKHPERYGLAPAGANATNTNSSSSGGGGGGGSDDATYSNRAKGLARAVLDSIPLVTFQVDKPNQDNKQKDVEFELESELDSGEKFSRSFSSRRSGHTVISDSSMACPICFEQFEDGEIMRDLPCQHKFHAHCVDPWLLNSSSHCPLCRVDLSLSKNEQVSETPPDDDSNSSSTLQQNESEVVIPDGYQVETSMFNRFLDIWNAQLLPKENRRAVLQQFHQEAEIRRQLRTQNNDQQRQQNRNRWVRFVNSRRQLFGRNNTNNNGDD